MEKPKVHRLTDDAPLSTQEMRRIVTEMYVEACLKKATMHDILDCAAAEIIRRMDRLSMYEFLTHVGEFEPNIMAGLVPCECEECKGTH